MFALECVDQAAEKIGVDVSSTLTDVAILMVYKGPQKF